MPSVQVSLGSWEDHTPGGGSGPEPRFSKSLPPLPDPCQEVGYLVMLEFLVR